MSSLQVAFQFIQDNDFKSAIAVLKKSRMTPDTFQFLSLLYRYTDAFFEEEGLVSFCKGDFNTPYFKEREKWHAQKLFDKLTPRQICHMPQNPYHRPTAAMMEQTCIIACAGSKNLEWLIELLESIHTTARYKDLPIRIVDTGTTDEDKHYICQRFKNTEFRVPPTTIPLINAVKAQPAQLAVHCYPFFDVIFPEFEYFIHLEPDTWIQDERGLDQLLVLAERDDMTKCTYSNSVMCYKKGGKLLDEWRALYLQYAFHQNEYNYYAQEKTQHAIWEKHKLPHTNDMADMNYIFGNYGIDFYGLPVIKHDPILRTPFDFTPISIVNNHNKTIIKGIGEGNVFFLPTLKLDQPLTKEAYEGHKQVSQAFLKHPVGAVRAHNYDHSISLRFRTWPWADKPQILSQLLQEATVCLG